jgi:hypothetical protein
MRITIGCVGVEKALRALLKTKLIISTLFRFLSVCVRAASALVRVEAEGRRRLAATVAAVAAMVENRRSQLVTFW